MLTQPLLSFKSTFMLSPYRIDLGHRKNLCLVSLTKGSITKKPSPQRKKGGFDTTSSDCILNPALRVCSLVSLSSFSLSSHCPAEMLLACAAATSSTSGEPCAKTTYDPANAPQILPHTVERSTALPKHLAACTPTGSDAVPLELQPYQLFPPALRLRQVI